METHKEIAYIGSGAISLIDAACKNFDGQSVYVFERSNFVGGVWAPTKLPGSDIECDYGLHYLLPSRTADEFFRAIFGDEYKSIDDQYDFTFLNDGNFLRMRRSPNGRYFKFGSFSLMEGVKKIVSLSNIEVNLGASVNVLHVNTKERLCQIVLSDKRIYTCSRVVLTSGVVIPNIFIDNCRWDFDLTERVRIRPQLYLQLEGTNYKGVRQAILKNHEQIKYIHDITDYSKGVLNNSRLYIISFRSLGNDSEKLVLKVMKKIGMIEDSAKIIYAYSFAPMLSRYIYQDLEKLVECSNGLIQTIYTEDFAAAIGSLSLGWVNILGTSINCLTANPPSFSAINKLIS